MVCVIEKGLKDATNVMLISRQKQTGVNVAELD